MSGAEHTLDLPPRGLIAELVTPFTQQGQIDYDSLQRLINQIEPRVEALLLAGPVCGGPERLGPEQRIALAEFCTQICSLPLLVFVTGSDGDRSLACARELGRSAAAERIFPVSAPLMIRSNRGLPDWILRLSRSAGKPVMLYNHPGLVAAKGGKTKRTNIRPSVFRKCLDSPVGPAGLIFHGATERMANFHKAVKNRPGFRTYEANENRFVERPSSAGLVSSGVNLLPRAWNLVTRAALFDDPGAGSAELLAAAEAVKTLASRRRDRLTAWLTTGLIQAGIFDSRVAIPPGAPGPESLARMWTKLNLPRWIK